MQIGKTKFILCLVGSFMLGICLMGSVFAFNIGGGIQGSQSKFHEIETYIDKYYLNDYENEALKDGAYKGMVSALDDPYSQYMNKDEFEQYMTSSMGEYSGVGITFSADEDGNYVVISISKDSPAEKAGVEPGDFIISVDGKTYTDIDTMASNIRGPEGTKVTIEYTRNGKAQKVTMKRANIKQESVEYKMLDDETGYIQITQFIDQTGEDFDSALKAVTKKGAKKLVLDLRDNGGGLVDESVDVADQFLDEGVVCYVEDKNGNSDTYVAKDGKTDLETVILVNGNSASASEILAGALKDNGFKIIGEKTFGKGIIQSTFELEDGSGLKLTIMQYLSPDKHVIHKKGIKPDVKVKNNEKTDTDEPLEKAKELLK